MIEIVSATRASETEFWSRSALGLSLRRLVHEARIARRIAFDNRTALPQLFNACIDDAAGPDVVVFVHDDVWLEDMFVVDRVQEGLERFDVVGVAGNRRRVPRQPAWLYVDASFARDDAANLAGCVAHGKLPFGEISRFGPVPAPCMLLDGVLLAARRSVLRDRGVRFDPQFAFDFYDMDFCRSAGAAGLRLGAWPLAITHQSVGKFNSPAWKAAYGAYLEKWGD